MNLAGRAGEWFAGDFWTASHFPASRAGLQGAECMLCYESPILKGLGPLLPWGAPGISAPA